MATRKKKAAPKKPKGIRKRVTADGREVYDPLVWVDGKQRSLGVCDTFDEAVAMRHAHFKALANAGKPVRADAGILTVAQLGTMCLTSEWDVDRWRARVLNIAEFAHWPATQVSEEHVQIWVDKMANTPIATGRGKGELPTRGTLHSAISLLRRVYRWAKMPARKYVTHNPAQHVTIGNSTDVKPKSKRNVFDYLREDEAKRLIDAPRELLPLEPRTKFLVMMFSGARPSDVFRLRWERIDWSAESIRFTSAKTSKQEARDYTVHALPQLTLALREWWMACGRPATGLVFPAGVDEEGNEVVHARGYDAGWQDRKQYDVATWVVDGVEKRKKSDKLRIMKGWRSKIGIKRDVPLYALRHTCACQLLLGGELFTGGRQWNREEVQSQLGHRDSKATEFYLVALGILNQRASRESRAALKLVKAKSEPR